MEKCKFGTRTFEEIKKALEEVQKENIWYSEDETTKWVEEQIKRFEKNEIDVKNNKLTSET